MEKVAIVAALAALAQEARLDIFRFLVQTGPSGVCAGTIGERLALPPATLSFHLKVLQYARLAERRRQGRSLIYTANFDTMNTLMAYLTENCCAGAAAACALPQYQTNGADKDATTTTSTTRKRHPMNTATDKTYNVLFLCTGNSARSVMAECALTRWGGRKFRAFSAGSYPKGEVHPVALRLLEQLNYSTAGLRSKSWDEFAQPDSPPLDFVFTVCDNAAGEACPAWPGQPMTAHWGVEDPAAFVGEDDKTLAFFNKIYLELESRIKIFSSLPLGALDNIKLQKRLDEIGTGAGRTHAA
jgi:arsenate reductase